MKFIAVFCLLFSPFSWSSEVREFVREYTYNASENDSKVSARKAAMQQLQLLLIQEVGVQVHASFEQTETLDNDVFSRQVQANYQTFSRALTKTKILKQKWDGETFYLKALITVDTDSLTEKIRLITVSQNNPSTPNPADCKTIHNRAIDMLAEANRPEVVRQLVGYSKQYPIDKTCYRWQLGILNTFTSLELDPAGYRSHLFERIEQQGSSYAGDLMLAVLPYALAIQPLSPQEWLIVAETLQRSTRQVNNSTVRILVNHTQAEKQANIHKKLIEKSQQYQPLSRLKEQLQQLTQLAAEGKLGTLKPFTVSDLSSSVLNSSINRMPAFFMSYYQQVHQQLDISIIQGLANTVAKDFKNYPNNEKIDFLDFYVSTIELDRNSKRWLFSLILDLRKNRLGKAEFKPALTRLLKNHPHKMTEVIISGRYNRQAKEQMLIEYQLAHDSILPVEDYARMLFSEHRRERQSGADYLLAFGQRAAPVKPKIQKVLSRIKEINKVESPRDFVVSLLTVLDNIKAKDAKSVELMVWFTGDLERNISKKAEQSLTLVGGQALETIRQHYPTLKPTAQRRLITVIGSFLDNKEQSLEFLRSIKPETPQQKFAVEDAITALQ